MTQPPPQPAEPTTPHWWNDQELFLRGLAQSNYVTACWDWCMMLLGKAAEPVLFVSVLYSGYQLLPGVPRPGAVIDAPMFVTQQAALDIGGLGLMKMAKHAHLSKDSFPYRVGMILVVLMIANVAIASLEKVVQLPSVASTIIEAVLLIARAVMAVLYGHAIHALKDEGVTLAHEPSGVQHQVEQVQQSVEELAQGVQQQGVQVQQLEQHLTELVQRVQWFREELHRVQSELPQQVQQGVYAEVQSEVQAIHTEVQHVTECLAEQVQEQVAQILNQRLNLVPEQQAEYSHTWGTARGSAGSVPSSQDVPSADDEPRELHPQPVHSSGAVNRSGKQGEQGAKVQRFITEQLAQGHTPTLKEIMQACHCSKNTAIQHRRVLTSNGNGQEPGHPKLTVVRG